jgi:capsid protein
MKIGKFEFKFSFGKPEPKEEPKIQSQQFGEIGSGGYGGDYWPIMTKSFDGEKTPGELGLVVRDLPHYLSLRLRGYHAYTTTDIVKTLASRRFQWVIGTGLKLECEPNTTILKDNGIEVAKDFRRMIEARWTVYTNSVYCDYEERRNLHGLAMDFYMDKFRGGDCLVVCRVENSKINAQFISGEHIKTPIFGNEILNKKPEKNTITHGIEYDERGKQVAFYVSKKGQNDFDLEYERIEAYGSKSKRKLAWMIYGQKLSPDHKRGVPEYTQILERISKLDRYTEASVSKAEQAAKILFAITHDKESTGEDIMGDLSRKKLGLNKLDEKPDGFTLADGLANKIYQSTSNQTFNMPIGSKLESFNTDIESVYGEFYKSNFDSISASVDTPPEVAMQQYNSNYSASRAAQNAWGYVIDVDRADFANQFYKPFYKLWFQIEVLNNKIEAPGFIQALMNDDYMVVEAYTQSRFVGRNMPHIDPLKEAKAIRELLGNPKENVTPLISHEQAAEMANVGDFEENYLEYQEEKNDLIIDEFVEPINNNGNGTA